MPFSCITPGKVALLILQRGTQAQGLPGGKVVKKKKKKITLPMQEMQETQVRSLGLEDPLEEEMATTPVFLLGKSHGQRSLVGYSPQGCKESDVTEHTHYTTTQA